MELTFAEAAWFLPFVLPICLWVAWSDLREMRIPNVAVLALAGGFLAIGLIVLPFDAYLWRLAQLLGVLVIGFVIASIGMVGAGDAKFAAAMAPFIVPGDVLFFLLLFSVVLIASWATHRGAARVPAVRRATPDWVSWERGKLFPMGVALAGALSIYLILGLGLWA
ncbi:MULTISPECIES: prepilin peptidase [Rhodophyticola]|jgi:prepilin peptidase CpaA|uniref:prepilin peptidase n=1 Tax=Rhodophyticola TaxID=2680018 RepID=UPI001B087D7F|nr:prepilin peptidase [Roseicyclus sp.]MBO6624676.1 prepilin peptidase [Roseicyclus sp.]MBO6921668.1 prepilin peptidase [Roseicyclus sp.]